MAAVTLGIVGPQAFARRTGRNEAFNHAGNAVAAALAGITAYSFGPIVVFWLLAAMAVASIFATLSIPPEAIDHHVARGLDDTTERNGTGHDTPSGFQVLLTCKPLLIFCVATVLFHFSNAAMLPLVGQKLALVNRDLGTTLMSVCIVAAQMVMVPVAMLVGHKADVWGRKPIFAVALAVLTLRGVLYPLSDNPYWLVVGAVARRRRRRHFRRAVSAGRRRSDARHRPFQRQPGRDRDRRRTWRRTQHGSRGPDRRQGGLQRSISVSRRRRRCGADRVYDHDAGNIAACPE